MARARWGHLELRTSFVASEFSPIEGREPAFEAGDAGSIPARGAMMVAVVYWSARLAVNEEVRVRSPPVTPQATTGCGSMAGHLARNQVHAGSIPAAQTGESSRRKDAPVPKTGVVEMSPEVRFPPLSTALWTTRQMSGDPLKAQDRSSTPGRVTTSHWSTRRRMPDFQSGERGSTPRWDTVRECCRMVGNRSRKPGWW